MKRKKGLFAIVAALAVSSVMAAMAYSSATVENAANLSIVSSDEALLSLIPGIDIAPVGNQDETAYLTGTGALAFNFDKGLNDEFGMQPDSVYIWKNLFYVKNNSEDTIKFKVSIDANLDNENWIDIGMNTAPLAYGTPADYNQAELWVADGVNVDKYVELRPGDQLPIQVRVQTNDHGNAANGEGLTGKIIVSAQAQ